MSELGEYETITENPGGSHARASMIDNVWVVTCNNCGTYDIVGPGHPAVRDRGDGTHEIYDRSKFRHDHADGCDPDPESGYSLDFAIMGRPQAMPRGKLAGPLTGLIAMQFALLLGLTVWRLSRLLTGMLDLTLGNTLLKNLLATTAAGTWAPTGGTSLTITPPLKLKLMQVTGTEAATGTEQTGTNGYTTGGSSLGTAAFSGSSAVFTNINAVVWTATGTWANATNGCEIYDSSGTPVRIIWGALSVAIAANAVTNTDTVTFAASTGLSASGATW